MKLSPYFIQLRSAYEAELDDLTSDSEGRDVLSKRLAEKRKELKFLIQMIELSPEMVAVIFHRGFSFKLPAVMDHLLLAESDELPEWSSLADAVQLAPWAQALAQEILKAPMGAWFLTVAAALEYMYAKPGARPVTASADDEDTDGEGDGDEDGDGDADTLELDEDEKEARLREDAGADWMVEQGFDRKDRS
jgi:hypothetical protein